jgi:hypothetical protein
MKNLVVAVSLFCIAASGQVKPPAKEPPAKQSPVKENTPLVMPPTPLTQSRPPQQPPANLPSGIQLTAEEQKDAALIMAAEHSLQLQQEILRRTVCMRVMIGEADCGDLNLRQGTVTVRVKQEPKPHMGPPK